MCLRPHQPEVLRLWGIYYKYALLNDVSRELTFPSYIVLCRCYVFSQGSNDFQQTNFPLLNSYYGAFARSVQEI